MSVVPEIRIRVCNRSPVRPDGSFVLYWMTAFRRTTWNFALDRSAEWAQKLQRPLVILEALRCDYPWASDRLHSFIVDGMVENASRLENSPALYYPFVETSTNGGKGLFTELARHACVIVTDDFPCFFLPRMISAAAEQTPVRMEAVDSNGLLPLRAADRVFPTAYSFRRFLQKTLPFHLMSCPKRDPLRDLDVPSLQALPRNITTEWPKVTARLLKDKHSLLAKLPINHDVPAVPVRGGSARAQGTLRKFLREKLHRYRDARNDPGQDATSTLSPYLHFGHLSSHQIFFELTRYEGWTPADLALRATGSREGWWGIHQAAEAFLDQFITWRELGFNFCCLRTDYDQFTSLPAWAQKTLRQHKRDERTHIYALAQFERAQTHDSLWTAAQTELVREGRIHNYLRMLWGKKILEWTKSPAEALAIMIELNNKYALDGRDPNSYSGIFWCLGRYDRPWGPERPVFGTVRYMSSANTDRKLNVKGYLETYRPD